MSVVRVPWPATGFVSIKQILGKNGGPLPICESRWYRGVQTGEFPNSIKIAGKSVWRVSDIDALIEKLEREAAGPAPRGRPASAPANQAAADAVIHNPRAAGTGDCLFGDAGTSQTFRWIESGGQNHE